MLGDPVTQDGSIDLKLLKFSKETNLKDVRDLVEHELGTCLYVSRFEFLHKLIILKLWQAKLLQVGTLDDVLAAFN